VFNPKRAAEYLYRMLGVLLPALALLLLLGAATELLSGDDSLQQAIVTPRFWLATVRNMIPGLVVMFGAFLLAARFAQEIYDLGSYARARRFVRNCLFGLWSFGPWVRITGGTPESEPDDPLLRVGGPGHLVIYGDSAVVLQKGGRITSVVGTAVKGKAFPRLDPLQSVFSVLDLRAIRKKLEVEAMSKEGIPVTCEADVSCRIQPDGVPSKENPYPTTPEAVFQASVSSWIGKDGEDASQSSVLQWSDRIIVHETDDGLRSILAKYPLDRLVGLKDPTGADTREQIRNQLQARLKAACRSMGAQVLQVELGDIRPNDKVAQQWVQVWRAEWKRRSSEQRILGRVKQTEQLEAVKTRAQISMLAAISDAFEPSVADGKEVTSKLILTRLLMVLSRAPTDPLTRIGLPREAISTLEMIRKLVAS
jgi:hypothetical protein